MATRIYCPRCEWAPDAADRWMCQPGCSMEWNTFETRARCPGCGKQWRMTQCLVCLALSLHEHWYHEEEPDRADEGVEEEERVEVGVP